MTVRCNVVIDANAEAIDLPFEAVPRIGESVALPLSGETRVFRVTRVQHTIEDDPAGEKPHVLVEVTSNIL